MSRGSNEILVHQMALWHVTAGVCSTIPACLLENQAQAEFAGDKRKRVIAQAQKMTFLTKLHHSQSIRRVHTALHPGPHKGPAAVTTVNKARFGLNPSFKNVAVTKMLPRSLCIYCSLSPGNDMVLAIKHPERSTQFFSPGPCRCVGKKDITQQVIFFFPPLPSQKNLHKAHLTPVLILIDFSTLFFCMVMMDAADESADGVGK